jgi:hypothetical protein
MSLWHCRGRCGPVRFRPAFVPVLHPAQPNLQLMNFCQRPTRLARGASGSRPAIPPQSLCSGAGRDLESTNLRQRASRLTGPEGEITEATPAIVRSATGLDRARTYRLRRAHRRRLRRARSWSLCRARRWRLRWARGCACASIRLVPSYHASGCGAQYSGPAAGTVFP